jgi:type IV secretory pathway VirB2 component (pilin)
MQGGVSVLGGALSWIANLVTGSLATAAAVLAVAWLGIALTQGRFDWREGARVMLGCFILFGAPMLAKGILDAAQGSHGRTAPAHEAPPVVTPPPPPQFDPYAGAALPR